MELYSRLIAALVIGITFGMITFAMPETTRAKTSTKSQALQRRKRLQPPYKPVINNRSTAAQAPGYMARLAQIKKQSREAAATLQSALSQANQTIQQDLKTGNTQQAEVLQNDVKKTLATISSRMKKVRRKKTYVRRANPIKPVEG
jgi:uncharacterized protein YicC (UPF0701 family)